MHECTSITINSFHLFQRTFFNKGFVVEGERELLKERMKTNTGRGGEGLSISLCSLCKKNYLIFQTVVVAQKFLKRSRHFLKLFFIYEHGNIFVVIVTDEGPSPKLVLSDGGSRSNIES